MQDLLKSISIKVNDNLYIKDPETSDLGKDIVREAIDMFIELGFEDFTFKKLATRIKTTESSVYRYFENKHKLLLYLENWFWHWLEYYLLFSTLELKSSIEKLEKAIHLIDGDIIYDKSFAHIDERKLYILVSSGLNRTFYTNTLEKELNDGYFDGFVNFSKRLSSFVEAVNPNYYSPITLSSTIIEAIFYKKFISNNFPVLDDLNGNKKNFVIDLVKGVLINGKN